MSEIPLYYLESHGFVNVATEGFLIASQTRIDSARISVGIT